MIVQTFSCNVRAPCSLSKCSSLAIPLTMLMLALPLHGFAQPAKPGAPASTVLPATTAVKPAASKPFWSELTPLQQQALKPLAVSWNTISEAQKRKWLEVSKNYFTLSPADQTTLHSRMNDWVALSSQQRAEARLNFATTRELSTQLTPDEKRAKWQTYQALSPEEKRQLAAQAAPKPAGAALAVKPVAPQKLTVVIPQGVKPVAKPASRNTVNTLDPVNPASTPQQPSQNVLAAPGTTPSN